MTGADPDAEGGLVTFGVLDVEAAEAVELDTAGGEVVLASPYPVAFEPLELHAPSVLAAIQTLAKTTMLRMWFLSIGMTTGIRPGATESSPSRERIMWWCR